MHNYQLFLITLAQVDGAILSGCIGFFQSKQHLFTNKFLTQILSCLPCIWFIFRLLHTVKTVIIASA